MNSPLAAKKTTRPLAARLFIIGLWLFFAAMATEFVFRLAIFPEYRVMLQDMYARHPMFGHFNKPNLEVRRFNPMNYDVINHTNAMGFRGREADRERELRGLWVAGDSNTFGGYVEDEEVFVARLKKRGYVAANLASEGHKMADQVLVIRHTASLGHRPQAVVLAFTFYCLVEDFSEKRKHAFGPLLPLETLGAGKTPPTARDQLVAGTSALWKLIPRTAESLKSRLLKSSAVYGWLKVGIFGIPALRDWTREVGLRADVDLVFKADLGLLRPLSPQNPAMDVVRSTADFIASVRDMVEQELGVPFGVILLPSFHQIYPDRFERFVRHAGLQGEDLDPLRPLDALKELLHGARVTVLDVLPDMRQAGSANLIFPDDGHLNPMGHRIVADAAAPWLRADLGLEPDE